MVRGKASKQIFGTLCSSVNNLRGSTKLPRALSGHRKMRLGSLVAPSGGCTQSEGETLDLLPQLSGYRAESDTRRSPPR
jgi:hypothetical protein